MSLSHKGTAKKYTSPSNEFPLQGIAKKYTSPSNEFRLHACGQTDGHTFTPL